MEPKQMVVLLKDVCTLSLIFHRTVFAIIHLAIFSPSWLELRRNNLDTSKRKGHCLALGVQRRCWSEGTDLLGTLQRLCREPVFTWTDAGSCGTPRSAFLSSPIAEFWQVGWVPAARQREYPQCPHEPFQSIKAIRVEIKAVSPSPPPRSSSFSDLVWQHLNNRKNYSKYQRKYLSAVTPPTSVQLSWELIRCAVIEMLFWLPWCNLIKLERSERGL